MTATPAEPELQPRKQLRVRLRPNLLIVAQPEGPRTRYVVKDPVSLRFHRLDERQHFIVARLDGSRTLEDVRREYERAHRPERLSPEELEAFVSQLLQAGVVQNDAPRAGELLYAQSEAQRRRERRAAWLNFLAIRVPLFNPDRLLARLTPALGTAFSRTGVLLGLGLTAAALLWVAAHWDAFVVRLPALDQLLSFWTLVWLWVAVGLVKVLHELGHGVCCKRFGGEVPEMGLLLLFFFPAAYCNVSDSWRLRARAQRMAVSAAGIYVELVVAALATFVWWASDPASAIHHLCFGLMVVCGVHTVLINANPLLRFDGYYVLSDWLDLPNLAELSGRVVRSKALGWFGVKTPPEMPLSRRMERFIFFYGVASYCYRWVVLAAGLYLLYLLLEPYRLGSLCLVLAAGVVATMFIRPVYLGVRALWEQRSYRQMRPRRVGLAAAGLMLAALVVFAVPFPSSVEGTTLVQVEPGRSERVTVPDCGGFLAEVPARDGQLIREGEVLAVLTNPKLEVAIRLNEADQGLRRRQQQDQSAFLAERASADGVFSTELRQTESELEALLREHAALRRQQAQLTLRAPRSGVLFGVPGREQLGKWIERGAEVCRVGDGSVLRAVLLVPPEDRELVHSGARASVRVHGSGAARWPGVVSEVAHIEARHIPPQLSRRTGGDVPTYEDRSTGAEQPHAQHYLVAVRLVGADRFIHPGVMGSARVEAQPRTLWSRLRRHLATAFSWGL